MSICMVSRLVQRKTTIYSLLNFLFLKPLQITYFLVLNPQILTFSFHFWFLQSAKIGTCIQKRDKRLYVSTDIHNKILHNLVAFYARAQIPTSQLSLAAKQCMPAVIVYWQCLLELLTTAYVFSQLFYIRETRSKLNSQYCLWPDKTCVS